MWDKAYSNLAVDFDNTMRNLSQDCCVNEFCKLMTRRRESGNWQNSRDIMSTFKIPLEMLVEIVNPHSLSDYLQQIHLRTSVTS